MGFGTLKRTVVESADVQDDATVVETAAASTAFEAPSGFEGAPAAPADEAPARAAAPVHAMDDALGKALAEGRGVAQAEIDTAGMTPAPEDTPATGESSEAASTVIDDINAQAALDGADADGLVDLSTLNMGEGHSALVSLLRSVCTPEEAGRYAMEYNDQLRPILRQISTLDADKARREELLQKGSREAGYAAAGGGAISSILNKLTGSKPGKADKELAEFGRRRRALLDENSGVVDRMRHHIGATKHRQYIANCMDIYNDSVSLARAVGDYNETFLNAPAAAELKTQVERTAAETGEPVDKIMSKLGKGEGDAAALSALESVRVAALQDDAVVAASLRLEERETAIEARVKKATQQAESLYNFFRETLDLNGMQEHLTAAMRDIEENMPSPVAEAEEKQKLVERMREICESMAAAIDALFAKIGAKLGVAA